MLLHTSCVIQEELAGKEIMRGFLNYYSWRKIMFLVGVWLQATDKFDVEFEYERRKVIKWIFFFLENCMYFFNQTTPLKPGPRWNLSENRKVATSLHVRGSRPVISATLRRFYGGVKIGDMTPLPSQDACQNRLWVGL